MSNEAKLLTTLGVCCVVCAIVLVSAVMSFGKNSTAQQNSPYGQQLQGSHMLRQVKMLTGEQSSWGGGFFFFTGAMGGSSQTVQNVTFSWQGNDGIYRFQQMPIDQVRVSIDDNVGIPYVKFAWEPSNSRSQEGTITHVVIHVNERDWPQSIEMPLAGRK